MVIVGLLSWGYDTLNQQVVIEHELHNLADLADEVALHLDSHFQEKVDISLTLSTSHLIQRALQASNADLATLPEAAIAAKIEQLNQRWMASADSHDPFITPYLHNPVADYLRAQQEIMPGLYGEIFLTNRYGALVASTGKLTTLAHAHKYWWKAGYAHGEGKIFLDDRGFDMSVKGYVLGVVMPVRLNDEVIGLLKCNVNILSSLTNVIDAFTTRHEAAIKIVRTNGVVVAAPGVEPLSTHIDQTTTALLQSKDHGQLVMKGQSGASLVAYAPLETTVASDRINFGGSPKSIDHAAGNQSESWHVLLSLNNNQVNEKTHKSTRVIALVGLCFTLLAALAAWLLGRWLARPIVQLATTAQVIGEGRLDARAAITANDEIGSLARTLNAMAENLQQTMTSRDDLKVEVAQRIIAEEQLQLLATIDELTGAYNRRAFNNLLQQAMSRAKRNEEPLSLLMLDIDYFKRINDENGHDVGDQVLVGVVAVIQDSIRQEDLVARWGGEEFTILLPQTLCNAAFQIANRLRASIASHPFLLGHPVTVSIGLAILQSEDTPHMLLKRADTALYQAKEQGRDRVVYSPERMT